MDYITETYVELLYPGSMMTEGRTRKVEDRDASKIKESEDAVAFSFFDILRVTIEVDGLKVDLKSGRVNISPMHYYGKLYTAMELQDQFPEELELITRVKRLSIDKLVHCTTGDWMPFQESGVLVGTL